MADIIKGAVLGYGAAFNMGRAHANMMQGTEGITCVAICDIDPERTKAAKNDFPDVRTYNSVEDLVADEDVDLIANDNVNLEILPCQPKSRFMTCQVIDLSCSAMLKSQQLILFIFTREISCILDVNSLNQSLIPVKQSSYLP